MTWVQAQLNRSSPSGRSSRSSCKAEADPDLDEALRRKCGARGWVVAAATPIPWEVGAEWGDRASPP